MQYKEAIQKFNNNLKYNDKTKYIADYYSLTVDKVIIALQKYIRVKRNRQGNITKVWIDFTDTNSNINIKYHQTI